MPNPIVRKLTPGKPAALTKELVVTASVLADGKICLELSADGELAKALRAASWAENRAKLRGRQRPRPG